MECYKLHARNEFFLGTTTYAGPMAGDDGISLQEAKIYAGFLRTVIEAHLLDKIVVIQTDLPPEIFPDALPATGIETVKPRRP